MPPLLARPVEHLWFGGVAKRRARAVGLFIVAYVAVWMLAGIVLMASATAIEILGSAAGIPALAVTGFVAFIWQTTPLKQVALNFCHRPPWISPSGMAADRDSLQYGVSIALACVGACWALMLVPLVVHRLDCLTMAIIAAVLLLERQIEIRPTRWRLSSVEPIRTIARFLPAEQSRVFSRRSNHD